VCWSFLWHKEYSVNYHNLNFLECFHCILGGESIDSCSVDYSNHGILGNYQSGSFHHFIWWI
jgi:hypothetical protein